MSEGRNPEKEVEVADMHYMERHREKRTFRELWKTDEIEKHRDGHTHK